MSINPFKIFRSTKPYVEGAGQLCEVSILQHSPILQPASMEEINVTELPDESVSQRVRQRRVPAPKGLQEAARRADESTGAPTGRTTRGPKLTRGQRNEMQIRATLGALVLSALTLGLAAFLLGLFHRGEWPSRPNARPIGDNENSTLQALTLLQDQGSPYVIVFYSTKCMACRNMRAPFLRASTLLEKFVPCFTAEVSHEVSRKLARQLNVTNVPSIHLVRGQTHDLYKGARDPHAIVDFIKDSLSDKPTTDEASHEQDETSHQQESEGKQNVLGSEANSN